MRESEAIAPAPARGRAGVRIRLSPLEGGQELARRSEAGSLEGVGATVQTGVHLKWLES